MKKFIFPLVVVVLLAWIFVGKCNYNNLSSEFVAKQDSLNVVVDSLKEDNHQKDLQIGALEHADFDLRTLPVAYSQNQLFRIVIIPGYFSSRSNIDFKDYHEVIKFFNIDDTHVKRLENK